MAIALKKQYPYICFMTIKEAFKILIKNWDSQPADYKRKYKTYASKARNGYKKAIGEKIMRKMLSEAKKKEGEQYIGMFGIIPEEYIL